MLRDMMDGWAAWLLLLGLALGAVLTWLLLVRLPRDEADVLPDERPAEAAWIADTIERHGGVAPRAFVEEVLDLHEAYLRAARPSLALPSRSGASELPPARPGVGELPPAPRR